MPCTCFVSPSSCVTAVGAASSTATAATAAAETTSTMPHARSRRSELHLQIEEKAPAIIQSIRYFAKCRGTQIRIRVGKLRRIHQVDGLAPKRQAPVGM